MALAAMDGVRLLLIIQLKSQNGPTMGTPRHDRQKVVKEDIGANHGQGPYEQKADPEDGPRLSCGR